MIIGPVTLFIAFAALRAGTGFGLLAVFVLAILQSAAALIIPGLGTIQPAHFLLGIVSVAILYRHHDRSVFLKTVRCPRPGFWLLCTWVYALLSAVFLPRLFMGTIEVSAPSFVDQLYGSPFVPLKPSNGNITQTGYFTGDLVYFILMSAYLADRDNWRATIKALVVICSANVFFALCDIGTTQAGVTFVLDPIRNASYSILSELSIGNMPRVIGSFPEASSFATATVAFFSISARLWLGGVMPRLTVTIASVSLLLVMISTSATGYVAIAPCLALLMLGAFIRTVRGAGSRQDLALLVLGPVAAAMAIVVLMFNHNAFMAILDFADEVLLNKGTSQSAMERNLWNVQALEALVHSHYLGVGMGSARASSLGLASLSNLGVIGTALYAMFFLTAAIGRPSQDKSVRNTQAAARMGLVGALIAGLVSGTMVEPGLIVMALAAISGTRPLGPRHVADEVQERAAPAHSLGTVPQAA